MNIFEGEIFLDLQSERAEDKKFETTIQETERSRERRQVGGKQHATCEEKVAAEISQALGMAEKL